MNDSSVIDKAKIKTIDIVKMAKRAEPETPCDWCLEGSCQGEVRRISIFGGLMRVCLCEYHLEHHIAIMSLGHSHNAGHYKNDIDYILSLSHDACVQEANRHGMLQVFL